MKDYQPEIFRAMKMQDFYPHVVDGIQTRETHISRVFLTGPFAYKLKKQENLGFLDFTTLEKRKHYCQREVELNRRLAEDVYLEVVTITNNSNGYQLNGSGTPVEYAVKMRQLPEDASMFDMLPNGKIDFQSITALGKVLSEFYRNAKTDTDIDALGSWGAVWTNCEENFTQLEPFAGNLFDTRIYRIIRAANRSFMRRQKSLFYKRIESGKIRDCHGDLRTEHIYFTDEGIQIIDCIEFNDRFRYSDITSDLAFLAMDLDFLGFPEAAGSLLTTYVDCAKDDEVFTLISFYKCYRAVIRAKVNCFQFGEGIEDVHDKEQILNKIRCYMDLAYQYALEFTRPTMWVVCGMIASGKSTISAQLAEKFDIPLLSSDVIRKELFNRAPKESIDVDFKHGIYSEHATSLTYAKLLRFAQQEIERGSSVILDATFSSRSWRFEALRLAEDMDANIIFVECTAPDATLKERLKSRSLGGPVSDARLKHFEGFKNEFNCLNDLPAHIHIRVNTDLPLEETMAEILASDYFLLSEQTVSVIENSGET
jgi:aminoglycoside phosphotransferase family enzyme/predicted kinase